MYLEYFGLDEAPFSITPDPSFIYLSGRHRDALAHLLHGVGQGGSGGFVQLTGEVGTGKTTLCRALLEQVPPDTHIALVLNPLMSPVEMLAAICEELGVSTRGVKTSPKGLVDRLNKFLIKAHEHGERVVLVIDEAQNLSIEALEQVRLLTNLETSKDKLLQIILLGQPELRELLRRRSLRQLAQRITARWHLTPLGPEDTARYVRHRLEVAGAGRSPFTRSGYRALYQRSQGVPRLINIIADRALTGAFAQEKEQVDAALVNAAANEIQLGEPGVGARRWPRVAGAGLAAAALIAVVWIAFQAGRGESTAPESDVVEAPAPSRPEATAAEAGNIATPPEPAPADLTPESGLTSATGLTGVATENAMTEPVALATEPVEASVTGAPSAEGWFEEQDLRAWSGLAARWGAPADAALIEAACLGREGLGYGCVEDQGTWLRIRQLGLPVVLVLPGDPPGHLLLSGMERDALVIGDGDSQRTVDRNFVEQRWYGDYLVAWPQAPNWPREIGRGDTGEAVELVLELATRADQPYLGAAEFGPEFERWLMAFQIRNGLDPDGIVGPKTLLYLMRFSIEEPRLLSSLEEGR
ncbi:MAG: AAA family ATPase [Xanthomonadales bacterium]|nr:AAA family ATPase [Xanthomonadales bacterium]